MNTSSAPRLAALGLLLLSVITATAQVDVTSKAKVRVSITPLSGAQGAAATQVLTKDLVRTLLIDPVPASGAGFVVTGTADANGVTGQLTSGGQVLVSKTYSGDWRHATHQFADDITLATTGVVGFATSRVAFISSQTGQKELYVMDIDGANIKQLTQDKTISNGPAWSHNGKMIAYTSYKSGYPDVYLIKLDAGTRTRIAFFPGINSGPSFSPDDSKIALTLSKDGNPEIYVMPVTGGSPDRLTRTRGAETSPSWSNTGDQIVYSSDERGAPQLFVVPSNGGEPSKLSTGSAFNTEPSWSPDGKKIAYTLRQGGFQIGVYDVNERTGKTVSTGSGEDPSWTRNSRHLVYASGGSLYILDSVTKLSMRLENGLKNCTEPAVGQ